MRLFRTIPLKGLEGVRLRPEEPALSLPKGLKPEGLISNLKCAKLLGVERKPWSQKLDYPLIERW